MRRAALWRLGVYGAAGCAVAPASLLLSGQREQTDTRGPAEGQSPAHFLPAMVARRLLPPTSHRPLSLSLSLSLSLALPLYCSLFISLFTLSPSLALSLSLFTLCPSLSGSPSLPPHSLTLFVSLSLYFSLLTLCPALPNSLALIFSLLSHYLYLNSIYQTLAPLLLIRFHFLLVQRPCMW